MADSAAQARIALELGRARLAQGDTAAAAGEFRAAILADPTASEAYGRLASLLCAAGQPADAEQVFALGLRHAGDAFRDPDILTRLQGRDFDAQTTRAFYAALAPFAPEIRRALTPTAPLGAYDSGARDAQDAAIGDLLETHWRKWQAGALPTPRRANVLVEAAARFTGPLPRVLLLMPEYVSCHPDYVRSTVASHALASLHEIGAVAELHAGDHLCFDALANAPRDDRLAPAEARAALDAHIARFRPDVVVMDAMFSEASGALRRSDLRMLKLRYGFKLIALASDAYPPLVNFALHWADVADLAITLTGRAYGEEAAKFTRVVQAPCQPIARALLGAPQTERPTEFLYVGSRRRYRDLWCAHAIQAGLAAKIVITDRRAAFAPSEADYYRLLREARVTVNSGYVGPGVDIVTFRLFEAAALGTLTLNEARAPNDDYFVPYVHYIPFDNVHEMVCAARFVLAHETVRARMADAARTWLWDRFTPQHFWRAVFAELEA